MDYASQARSATVDWITHTVPTLNTNIVVVRAVINIIRLFILLYKSSTTTLVAHHRETMEWHRGGPHFVLSLLVLAVPLDFAEGGESPVCEI